MTDDNNGNNNFENAGPGQPPPDFDDNADFDDFAGGQGSSLGDMWRNSPLVKVGVVAGVIVLLIAGMVLFGGDSEKTPGSSVTRGSDLKQPPAAEEVSKVYAEAVEEKNTQDLEKAQREGTSAIPVPINAPKTPLTLGDDSANAEDPLARWRRIQEERSRREAAEKTSATPQNVDPNAEAVKALADALSRQMQTVLQNVKAQAPQYKLITEPKAYFDEQQRRADEAAQKRNDTAVQAAQDQEVVMDILQPAGEIEYAQLITQANSDVPGPILAQIASGPLSGSRIIGSFETQDDYLVLTFNTVVIDGVSHPMNAVALDPKTANSGLATDVDHRYFKRVILPAAASFIQGLGSAIADSGNTDVSVSGDTVVTTTSDLNVREEVFKGIEEAASKAGDVLDREGSQTKPLVIVAAGTPMGLFFIEPVTQEAGDRQARR